jgi:hypothetical protein
MDTSRNLGVLCASGGGRKTLRRQAWNQHGEPYS